MRMLCLQFQPKSAVGLSANVVTSLMARIASTVPEVRRISFERGADHRGYINYCFSTRGVPASVWRAVDTRGLKHPRIGKRLRRASIVTCTGSRGWDNYLLLHHFEGGVQLDRLSAV